MRVRAEQRSTTTQQEVTKTTSVGGEDSFIDLCISAYASPSNAGGRVSMRMDVKHATELHRKLGARIKTAKRWAAREEAARRRNAQKRRAGGARE